VWSRGVARWFRRGLSVADPFVCRCLTSPAMLPFSHPLIEPDVARAVFRLPNLSKRFWPLFSV